MRHIYYLYYYIFWRMDNFDSITRLYYYFLPTWLKKKIYFQTKVKYFQRSFFNSFVIMFCLRKSFSWLIFWIFCNFVIVKCENYWWICRFILSKYANNIIDLGHSPQHASYSKDTKWHLALRLFFLSQFN